MTGRVFKSVQGEAKLRFVRPSELKETGAIDEVVLEGEFQEALPNQHRPEVNDFKFLEDNGNTVIINHCGHLGFLMKNVNPGDYCRVTYKGTVPYKGKETHQFLVETAEDA